MEYFENIFDIKIEEAVCISLKKDISRRNIVKDIFKKLNLVVKFYLPDKNKDPVKGCLNSHIYCIEYAKKNKFKNILIFEDDVSFINLDFFKNKKINIPSNFDMLYLGYNILKGHKYSENLIKLECGLTTHAYIIQEHMYDEVLNKINENWNEKKYDLTENEKSYLQNKIKAIDIFYAKEIQDKYKNSYGIYPILATQAPGFSSIENKELDYSNLFNSHSNYFYNIIKSKFRGSYDSNNIEKTMSLINHKEYDLNDYIILNTTKKKIPIMFNELINVNNKQWDILCLTNSYKEGEIIIYVRMTYNYKSKQDLNIFYKYNNQEFLEEPDNVIHDKQFLCIYTKEFNECDFDLYKLTEKYTIYVCCNEKIECKNIIWVSKDKYSFIPKHDLYLINDIDYFIDNKLSRALKISLIMTNNLFDTENKNIFYNFLDNIDEIKCKNINEFCKNYNLETKNIKNI